MAKRYKKSPACNAGLFYFQAEFPTGVQPRTNPIRDASSVASARHDTFSLR